MSAIDIELRARRDHQDSSQGTQAHSAARTFLQHPDDICLRPYTSPPGRKFRPATISKASQENVSTARMHPGFVDHPWHDAPRLPALVSPNPRTAADPATESPYSSRPRHRIRVQQPQAPPKMLTTLSDAPERSKGGVLLVKLPDVASSVLRGGVHAPPGLQHSVTPPSVLYPPPVPLRDEPDCCKRGVLDARRKAPRAYNTQ